MKEKVILKSAHPEEYGDLVIECRVIPNVEIGEYLATIPEDRKFYAHKSGIVKARSGKAGEVIKTTLKTVIDGREYILGEEENTVKERESGTDIVVTNISSTSNEEYVVKRDKFTKTYSPREDGTFEPAYDSRLFTQVTEDVIIMTSWGAPAICLAGSYIVTYSAEENDYNTVEQGAFESTYEKENQPVKVIK